MVVTMTMQETYDLQTTVGKMGLIAIHTPTYNSIHKLYSGLLLNHKYFHLDRCDFAVACASVQPADPLQVGTEAGSIAPQDLFNPLLYTACSTDSYNTIVSRALGLNSTPLNGNSGTISDSGMAGSQAFSNAVNSEQVYYSLLGESGWRKAMPQAGFTMSGLKPLVYTMVNTFGNAGQMSNSADGVGFNAAQSIGADGTFTNNNPVAGTMFRGESRPMPRLPTTIGPISSGGTVSDYYYIQNTLRTTIPKTMVALIIVPPAKQHILYYRLRVVWTVSFIEPASVTERLTPGYMANIGTASYGSNIVSSSAKDLDNKENFVDTQDVDMNLIMQS